MWSSNRGIILKFQSHDAMYHFLHKELKQPSVPVLKQKCRLRISKTFIHDSLSVAVSEYWGGIYGFISKPASQWGSEFNIKLDNLWLRLKIIRCNCVIQQPSAMSLKQSVKDRLGPLITANSEPSQDSNTDSQVCVLLWCYFSFFNLNVHRLIDTSCLSLFISVAQKLRQCPFIYVHFHTNAIYIFFSSL